MGEQQKELVGGKGAATIAASHGSLWRGSAGCSGDPRDTPFASCNTSDCRRPGLAGWCGKTKGERGEKGSNEHWAPGVGLRQDPERQDPCTEHRGKGTLGTLPQRSVFLRKSPAELRLASPLRGPNSTVFSPPITTSSSSFLHSHPPPVLLSVNNSFWFWTSRDQQILEGVGKTLVLDFFFPFSLEFWVFELQKIISINIKIYVFRQMDFLENYERS